MSLVETKGIYKSVRAGHYLVWWRLSWFFSFVVTLLVFFNDLFIQTKIHWPVCLDDLVHTDKTDGALFSAPKQKALLFPICSLGLRHSPFPVASS